MKRVVVDDLVTKKICDAIRGGNTRATSAQAAGISVGTLRTWLQRGRRGEAPYDAFFEAVQRADAEAEMTAVEVIRVAALRGTWQAAAWWLERRRQRIWTLPRVDWTSHVEPEAKKLAKLGNDELRMELERAQTDAAALLQKLKGT